MLRRLKQSTPAESTCVTFDQGKHRRIDAMVAPHGVYVKARGLKGWKFLAWTSVYDRAIAAEAGFDPSPRSGRITRGS